MSNTKTRRKLFEAGRICTVLLLSLLVSACRSVQAEGHGEQQNLSTGSMNSAKQPRQAGETDPELKPKRRTVLIGADSFSPGAYLPFNASCFDCFLFPT